MQRKMQSKQEYVSGGSLSDMLLKFEYADVC
jgi:hypothetical protein